MWKLLAPAKRKEMWFSAGRPLGFTAAQSPSGAPGLEPNQEQLGKIAICQSNQIISNPRAGTGSSSCSASSSIPRALGTAHAPCVCPPYACGELNSALRRCGEAWSLAKSHLSWIEGVPPVLSPDREGSTFKFVIQAVEDPSCSHLERRPSSCTG